MDDFVSCWPAGLAASFALFVVWNVRMVVRMWITRRFGGDLEVRKAFAIYGAAIGKCQLDFSDFEP